MPPFAVGSGVPEYDTANVPLPVTGEPDTDRNDGTVIPTEVTVPPEPEAVSVPPTKLSPEPMVTLLNPPDPLPYRMLVPLVAEVALEAIVCTLPPLSL